MEKTPAGTTVGVDDPYAAVDRCDHLTDDGRCRFAVEHGQRDPRFADARSADDFRCPVVGDADEELESPCVSERSSGEHEARSDSIRSDEPEANRGVTRKPRDGLTGPWDWRDCPHFRCRNHDRECARCGLGERRVAHDDERPLLEEHHLSYRDDSAAGDGDPSHEITVYLCRWCHAKVHDSWARIDDDVNPDPEAIAEREARRSREQAEMGFETAADRFERD